MGGQKTDLEKFLQEDFLAPTAVDLFSATLVTNTTVTGATISVKRSNNVSILFDVTGVLASGTGASTGATGLIVTFRGGQSGFAFHTIRTTTAGLGSFAFKLGVGAVMSGATAESTGVDHYEDIFMQVTNPASATGGSVTVRARAYLNRSGI